MAKENVSEHTLSKNFLESSENVSWNRKGPFDTRKDPLI